MDNLHHQEIQGEIMPTALITGITGQDGSYLAELLLKKNYQVHGLIRPNSTPNNDRIQHIINRLHLHPGDITDSLNLNQIVQTIKPDQIYHLAAQSHVHLSFVIPELTSNIDALGTLKLLEAVRRNAPKAKFYQASTSELFGNQKMPTNGYNEKSPMHPRSPYGVAKLYAYWMVRNYREANNLFASNGILFNHESPRRSPIFVTKKIISWCVQNNNKISNPKLPIQPLELGNIHAKRDWGHAQDYVLAMWMIIQHPYPDDWIVSTGETYSVKQFIQHCFNFMKISIKWKRDPNNPKYQIATYKDKTLITQNDKYYRPTEVPILKGNSQKIRKKLNWKPKHTLETLIQDMWLSS